MILNSLCAILPHGRSSSQYQGKIDLRLQRRSAVCELAGLVGFEPTISGSEGRPSAAVQTPPGNSPVIDWARFQSWLTPQYSKKHAGDLYRYAAKYWTGLFQPAEAVQVQALPPDLRRHVIESLAALSKFLGCHAQWRGVRQQADLRWTKASGLQVVRLACAPSERPSSGRVTMVKLTRFLPHPRQH